MVITKENQWVLTWCLFQSFYSWHKLKTFFFCLWGFIFAFSSPHLPSPLVPFLCWVSTESQGEWLSPGPQGRAPPARPLFASAPRIYDLTLGTPKYILGWPASQKQDVLSFERHLPLEITLCRTLSLCLSRGASLKLLWVDKGGVTALMLVPGEWLPKQLPLL